MYNRQLWLYLYILLTVIMSLHSHLCNINMKSNRYRKYQGNIMLLYQNSPKNIISRAISDSSSSSVSISLSKERKRDLL